MLLQMQIMSGFKDIRSVFRTNCNILKPANELALWFTLSADTLYVHDMEEHSTSMALAFCISKIQYSWQIRLRPSSPGELLIKDAIEEDKYFPNNYLNDQYQLRDLLPPRLLK